MRKFCVVLLSSLIPLAMGTLPVHATGYDKWSGRLSVELKVGSNDQIGTLDVLAPLWQQTDRLLFADVRLVDSSGPSIEGNLGLGFRKLEQNTSYFGGEWVWGVYGFYDRRHTSSNNNFSQATIGAELYTDNWLLRGNYYNPESSGKTVATRSGSNEVSLSGTEVILQQSPSLVAKEYALPGMDIEAGQRFDLSDNQELWLYAGYFDFNRSEAPKIAGPRLRAEYRQYNAFDIVGSEFTVGVEFQHDDIRDSKEFFSLRLSIPFGESGSKKPQPTSSNIEQRMTEYVVRDKDIVSFAQDINEPVGSEQGPELAEGSSSVTGTTPVTDPATGEQLNVFIVDNVGGGDCSQASPCTLAVAQGDASYGAGDIIIVTNSAGVVVGNVDLTAGSLGTERRQVVGGAAEVSLSLSSGDTLTVTGLGGRPTLNGIVTLANDASIRNFDLTSAGNGIVANGITNATINDVNINSAAATGISLQSVSGTVNVSNSSISNTSTAINLQSIGGVFNFSNTTVSNSVTGVDLGGAATNANLTYQGGAINAGVPVDTVGITAGSYDFTGTTIIKNNALSSATGFGGDFWFIDATGGGVGSSVDRASADFVETNSGADDIILLVDDGTGNINATGGFQLKNNQQLLGFAAGSATMDFTGSNANVLGNFQYQINDPTGNGAATLTNSGGTEVVTLADSNKLRGFNLTTTGAVDGIAGSGFTNLSINNMAIANAGAEAFDFINAAGTISITDSNATNSTGSGLRLNGGNATVALNNFDISDTGSGRSVDIQSTTGGSVTFDANSSIFNSGGLGVLINNIGGNVTFNGAVSVTAATNTAIEASTLNGNTVAFNAGLGTVSTTAGTAFLASAGTLNIAGTTTINATNVQALSFNNLTVGNGSGSALSFDSITSTGGANGILLSNVNAANGLNISGATLANNTTAGININGVSGSVTITASNIDTAAAGTGLAIAGANGTINIGTGGTGLDIDGGTTGVSINQTSGTVNLGTGASGIFAVDGTSGVGVTLAGGGTVNIGTGGGSSSIAATTDTGSTAFAATGGTVNANYAGSIALSSNVGLVSVIGGHNGTLTFSGALSNSAATTATQLNFNNADGTYNFDGTVSANTTGGTGVGIDVTATSSGTIDFDNSLTLATASGNAIQMAGAGSLDVSGGGLDVDTTSGTGLSMSAGSVSLSDATSIRASSSGTGINASGGTLSIASGAGTAEVISTSGQGLLLSGVTTGTGGVTFDTLNSGDGANGIQLSNVNAANGLNINSAMLANNTTAGININGVTGSASITAANIDSASTGLAIAGANGTLNIGNSGMGLDIDGGTIGVSINQTSGTLNLGTGASGIFAIDGTSGTGVTLAGAGTVNIGTGGGTSSIAATTDTGSTAFAITGGTVDVNYAGSIALSSNVGLVSVSGGHSGTATFNGNLSNSAATNATQLNFNNADGTYNFDGTVSTDTSAGTGIGLDIAATSSGTIDFDNSLTIATASGNAIQMGGTGSLDISGGSLDVDTTTGTGLSMSAGSVSLSDTTSIRASSGTGINASGGTFSIANGAGTAEVSSTSGQGVLLSGITTGTGGVTFDAVNSGGGANGISLSSVDATDGFIVTSSTLISNTTAGITLTNVSGTVNILGGSIQSTTADGIVMNNNDGSDASVNFSNITFTDNDLSITTSSASTEVCLQATGNSFNVSGGSSEINLTETADGSILRVPGVANQSAFSTANGSVTINPTGSIGYNETCTIP